jgi:hypothetical protein
MAHKWTEEQLASLGLQVNPEGTEIVRMVEDAAPDETWQLEQLDGHIRRLHQELLENKRLIGRGLRWRTLLKYRQGRALHLARQKVEAGGASWTAHLKELRISRSTDWRHRELFTRATEKWCEDAEFVLSTLTAGAAYRSLGIGKEPSEEKPQPRPERRKGGGTLPGPRPYREREEDAEENQNREEDQPDDQKDHDQNKDLREWLKGLQTLAEYLRKGGITWTKEIADQFRDAVDKIRDSVPSFEEC